MLAAHQTATDLAHFYLPIRDAGELDDRLGRLDTRQREADTAVRRVNQAAEFAATAVASTIQIPGFGENEIVDWLYLDGNQMKGNFTACALFRRVPRQEAQAAIKRFGMACEM